MNNFKTYSSMKNIFATLMIAALITGGRATAQDTRFSQPLGSPLFLNPAMMALSSDFRVTFNYRNQWGNIDKGYQTYAGSVQYPLFLKSKKDTVGGSRLDFGVNVLFEKAGAYRRVNAGLNVGYGLRITPAHLVSATLNVGFVKHSIDWNDQTFDEQFVWGEFDSDNPTGENPASTKTNFDVGFGILWHFTPQKGMVQAFAGVSGYHLNQPNLSFGGNSSKLPSRYNFQVGVKLSAKRFNFTPAVMYHIQGPVNAVTAGLLLAYKFEKAGNIVVGSWFKEKDAISLQAGFEHKFFNLHYSYDFGNSMLTRTTRGLMIHEVTLQMKWDMNHKNNSAAVRAAFL